MVLLAGCCTLGAALVRTVPVDLASSLVWPLRAWGVRAVPIPLLRPGLRVPGSQAGAVARCPSLRGHSRWPARSPWTCSRAPRLRQTWSVSCPGTRPRRRAWCWPRGSWTWAGARVPSRPHPTAFRAAVPSSGGAGRVRRGRGRVDRLRAGGGAAAPGRRPGAPAGRPGPDPGTDAGAAQPGPVGAGRGSQRSSRGSLPGLPSHSLASGSGSLRAVITGHSFASSALSATKCSCPAGTSSSG
jgi:hypothetical protein